MFVVTNKESLSDNVSLTILEFNEWDEQFIETLEKYFAISFGFSFIPSIIHFFSNIAWRLEYI